MLHTREPGVLPRIVVFDYPIVEVIVWIYGTLIWMFLICIGFGYTIWFEYGNYILIVFGGMMRGYGDCAILTHVGRQD